MRRWRRREGFCGSGESGSRSPYSVPSSEDLFVPFGPAARMHTSLCMKHQIARFRVRAGETEAVERAIAEFVAAVADEPGAVRYESWREADGVSYVHMMSFVDEAAEEAHAGAEHTRKFLAELTPRCEARPTYGELTKIAGSGR